MSNASDFRSQRGVHLVHLPHHLVEREGRGADADGLRVGAGVGEDLLDHGQELPAGADHALDGLALAGRDVAQHAVAQDLAVGDDGGERRAQLVRDVGEELALGHVEVAQLEHRALQLLDAPGRLARGVAVPVAGAVGLHHQRALVSGPGPLHDAEALAREHLAQPGLGFVAALDRQSEVGHGVAGCGNG